MTLLQRLGLAAGAFLTGAAALSSPPPVVAPVATVNGQPIPRAVFNALWNARVAATPGERPDPDAALRDLVDTELLSQLARTQGMAERPSIRAELELARKVLLGQRLMAALANEVQVSEAELRERHARLPADALLDTEHILLADEAGARSVLRQLGRGAAFAELARRRSIDRESRARGGHLGPLRASELAPAYAAIAQVLTPGQLAPEPVHTEFGWHVIRLRDRQALPAPPFDQMRDALRSEVVQERLQAQLETWRQQAHIVRLQAP